MKNIRKTNTEFINDAKLIHGDRYDYSLVEYITSKDKVKIICKDHGEFEQTPDTHVNKKGNCSICAKNKRLTINDFILRSRLIHGENYDYSLVNYVNHSSKVKIICLKHGEFFVKAGNHLRGDRCSKCTKNKNFTTEEFINKAKLIHSDKYDYSLVNYINQSKKVKIICHIHGEFEQNPNNHLNNNGCPRCKESKGEKMICELLIKHNIKFLQQCKFPECRDILELRFDFYLPDHNVCIEFNGRQHYEPIELWGGVLSLESLKKRDKIKTEYCKNNNIPLIIIKYNDKNLKKIEKLINPEPHRSETEGRV